MSARCVRILAFLCVGVFGRGVLAADLGDDAPALRVDQWVKGDPVDLAAGKGKHVYVIEFWATWCGPCVAGIPHLTELQARYKDQGVVLVSISSSDESLDIVKKFVAQQGDRMAYRIAYEDRDGPRATHAAYMQAFKKSGIPQCFVVDKRGKIVWEGHPRLGLEEVLGAVVAGESDIQKLRQIGKAGAEAFRARAEAQRTMLKKYFDLVAEKGNLDAARAVGDAYLRLIEKDAMALNAFAWHILTHEGVAERDLDLAMRAAKAAYDACGGEDAAIVDTYARALFDTGKVAEAIEYQKKAVELAEGNERLQRELTATLKRYLKATQ